MTGYDGPTQDSRLPAEFDATQALREGDNLLAVQVVRWCDGSYLEDQDHWWLSGLHRHVRLHSKPHALPWPSTAFHRPSNTFN